MERRAGAHKLFQRERLTVRLHPFVQRRDSGEGGAGRRQGRKGAPDPRSHRPPVTRGPGGTCRVNRDPGRRGEPLCRRDGSSRTSQTFHPYDHPRLTTRTLGHDRKHGHRKTNDGTARGLGPRPTTGHLRVPPGVLVSPTTFQVASGRPTFPERRREPPPYLVRTPGVGGREREVLARGDVRRDVGATEATTTRRRRRRQDGQPASTSRSLSTRKS